MLRNIDVVDCAATNVSCTNLTVKGEPVSNVLTNIGSSAVGNTVFTGIVTADNFTTTGAVTSGSITTGNITSTGSLNLTNVTVTGTITGATEVSATTLTGTLSTATQNNVTKIGTQTSLSNAGALTQTGAATFAGAVTHSSTMTQTGAATFATNITQSAGTSALKAVTCDSVLIAGNAPAIWVSHASNGAPANSGKVFTLSNTVMEITVKFFNLSVAANALWASSPIFQLADNGSYTTPTYAGVITGNNAAGAKPFMQGIPLWNADTSGSFTTAMRFSGVLRFYRVGSEFFIDGSIYRDDFANAYNAQVAGRCLLGTSGILSALQLNPQTANNISTALSPYIRVDYRIA